MRKALPTGIASRFSRSGIAAVLCVLLGSFVPDHNARAAERLFFATGDYDPNLGDDAILIFDDITTLAGSPPWSATYVVTVDGSEANFVHDIYYWDDKDELFVASVFTNGFCVYANAKTMTGTPSPAREVWGPRTGMMQPHGIWVDEKNDLVYVANTYGGGSRCFGNILVFENASTVTGQVPPSRVIEGDATFLAHPLDVAVDTTMDILYVGNANPEWLPPMPPEPIDPDDPGNPTPSILAWNSASSQDGNVAPTRRIYSLDPMGALNSDPLIHNVQIDIVRDELYVGNHDQYVLVYSSASSASGDAPIDRTLSGFNVAYGFFYLADNDRLYVADGGPPASIKIYDSGSTQSGNVGGSPSQEILWNPSFFSPAQPVWAQVHGTTGVSPSSGVRLLGPNPNPFSERTRIAYEIPVKGRVQVQIFDVEGALVRELRDEIMDAGEHVEIWDGTDTAGRVVGAGIYMIVVELAGNRAAGRVTRIR